MPSSTAQVARFAASLQRLGVHKGDRVALFLPNCPQFVIAYLAAVRIGAIAVPFNPLYSAREIEYQLNDCGAKVVVVLDRFFPIVQQVRARTDARARGRHPHQGVLPAAALGALHADPGAQAARGRWPRTTAGSRRCCARGRRRPVAVDAGETAVLLYTGGTTGVSKGVELSHRNLLVNAEQNRVWAGIGDGARPPWPPCRCSTPSG